MLISFSVENYRSYKNKTEINFFPEVRKNSKDDIDDYINVIDLKKKKKLLNSMFLYWYNWTGKSNLIRSLFNLKWLLHSSRNDEKPDFLRDFYDPFLFDKEKKGKESTVSVKWIMKDLDKEKYVEYYYEISYNYEKITREILKENNKNYDFSKVSLDSNRQDLPNITKLAKLWDKKMKTIFDYLVKHIIVVNRKSDHMKNFLDNYEKNHDFKIWADSLIRKADIWITTLEVDKKEINLKQLDELWDEKLKRKIVEFLEITENVEKRDWIISLVKSDAIHEIKNSLWKTIERFSLGLEEESMGITEFVSILYFIYRTIKKWGVLLIDEFTSFLHPSLVNLIIDLFKSNENWQLLVATHDVYFLNKANLRRDQVWISDKTTDTQETYINRVSDQERRSEINMADRFMSWLYWSIPNTLIDDL